MSTLPVPAGDPVKALIKAIAMDIGKEVVAYVEWQYPEAIKAASSSFRLSLRDSIYNQILAAIEVSDEGQVIARLNRNSKTRRKFRAFRKKVAGLKIGDFEKATAAIRELQEP